MKIKIGKAIIDLMKQVSGRPKGAEVPGHKYIRRIPLAGGKYKYIYKEIDGTESEQVLDSRKAKTTHPEQFDDKKFKYSITEDRAKEIVNFKWLDEKEFKRVLDGYSNPSTVTIMRGFLKEAFLLLSIPIAEGWVKNLDEAVYYLDDMADYLDPEKIDDRSKLVAIRLFMTHIGVLDNLRNPLVMGSKDLEAQWATSGAVWRFTKNDYLKTIGRKLNPKQWEFIPVGTEHAQDVAADALLKNRREPGWVLAAVSAKWNKGRPLTFKTGTYKTGLINWMAESGQDVLIPLSVDLNNTYVEAKKDIERLKLAGEDAVRLRNARVKQQLFEQLRDKPEVALAFSRMMIDKIYSAHDDKRADDTVLTITNTNVDGTFETYQARVSQFKKKLESFLETGNLVLTFEESEKWKGPDRKSYQIFGNINLGLKNPETGAITNVAIGDARNNKNSFAARFSNLVASHIMKQLTSDRERMTISDIIDDNKGFEKLDDLTLSKAKEVGPTTTKPVFGVKGRLNVKYLRKVVTPAGKVRYVYKEGEQEDKKEEVESTKRNEFKSKIDSVDSTYKALFESALDEIDDVHFINILAATSAIRFTADTETYFDFLKATQQQRQSPEFQTSSSSYAIGTGRMAFNISNFPDDIPDVIRKIVMMHEVGHAFFYGTVRVKNNEPVFSEGFGTENKEFLKSSTKFVDGFGKLDREFRQSIDESFPEDKIPKGVDKEEVISRNLIAHFVDGYAAQNDEEHFAQAFAYYFIAPEILKKKEEKIYSHFNEYFQKYKD